MKNCCELDRLPDEFHHCNAYGGVPPETFASKALLNTVFANSKHLVVKFQKYQ